MFEEQVGGPDAATTLSLVAEAHHTVLMNKCPVVESGRTLGGSPSSRQSTSGREAAAGCRAGREDGDGIPEVLEFAAAELVHGWK